MPPRGERGAVLGDKRELQVGELLVNPLRRSGDSPGGLWVQTQCGPPKCHWDAGGGRA